MQEVEATIINGKGTETGHIIVTTTGGKNGQPKQVSTLLQLIRIYQLLYMFLMRAESYNESQDHKVLLLHIANIFMMLAYKIVELFLSILSVSFCIIICIYWLHLQTVSYMAERIVGQGSFGIVFQVSCNNL